MSAFMWPLYVLTSHTPTVSYDAAEFSDRTDLAISTIRSIDWTATVTTCGRICYKRRKINLSTVFAGQKVGVKQVSDKIWLVSFMQYDLGYFDLETCRLEPIQNPFSPRVLPMSSI